MVSFPLVNQTERRYKIEQMLSESGVVSIESMLERLEISRVTFKRDLVSCNTSRLSDIVQR